VEVLESVLPVRIHEKTLRLGSGGAGRWRGGDGQRVVLEVVNPEGANMVILSQRLRFPPVGRQGGANGALGRVLLNGEPVQGERPFEMKPGDLFTLDLPGGGGFGDPALRDPLLVARDCAEGRG
jgi:N-methylhydantoinase B